MKITVGIVEDKPQLVTSLMDKLSLFDEFEVLWIAQNGKEAIDKVTNSQADLIFMDINMPVMDGIEATEKIKAHYQNVKVIMLTIFDEDDKILNSILAGADGYLLKDETPDKIKSSIVEVLDGGAPMSPIVASKALRLIKKVQEKRVPEMDFGLSKRETEILQELAKGHNYNEIADDLFISPKTVRKHIENVYRKLQVHNKVEAVQLALKNNLID